MLNIVNKNATLIYNFKNELRNYSNCYAQRLKMLTTRSATVILNANRAFLALMHNINITI